MARFDIPKIKYNPPSEELTEEAVLKAIGEMSYQLPVEILFSNIRERFEGDVMQIIHSYDINVDKDELVKALQYDRDQYGKGFVDGSKLKMDTIKREVAREIFEEIEKIIDKHHSECYEYEDGDECDTAITYISYISCDLDELKKKYTEGEGK